LIGSDPSDVVELKLNMYILARDGSNIGYNGYSEVYYDNFLIYPIGVSTSTETTTEIITDTSIITDFATITNSEIITTTTTEFDNTTSIVTSTATTPAWSFTIILISIVSIVVFYRSRRIRE
jgi:hypothetical protein